MKIGRNVICPCGSGKKYKKCCSLKKMVEPFDAEAQITDALQYVDDSDLEQFFGYTTERQPNESPFHLPEEGLCCMISKANAELRDSINQDIGREVLKLGDWFITANIGEKVKFSGPYDSLETSMNMAREHLGAKRFVSVPYFIL